MKSLRPIALPVAAVTLVCAVVALVVQGVPGLLGALLGGVVVVLFLGSTPVVLTPIVDKSVVLSLPAALGFFVTKTVAVVVVLLLLFDVGGLAEHVHPPSFGLTAALTSVVWTSLQVVAFRRDRTPTYDLGDNG